MKSSAINGRSGLQQHVSSNRIEKKANRDGVPDEARESPVPRAQFLSPITSCFKAIGNRICKALDSAVNAVNRARGAWALNSINSGYATPKKILSEIKFLKEVIGNDDEKLIGVIKWGSDKLSKPECTQERYLFERGAASALLANIDDKEMKSLVAGENDIELSTFYQNLCQKVKGHYDWIDGLINNNNKN